MFTSTQAVRRRDPPEPAQAIDAHDDEETEEAVEAILATRVRRGVRQYLTKWEGSDAELATWEPEACFVDEGGVMTEALAVFLALNPIAPMVRGAYGTSHCQACADADAEAEHATQHPQQDGAKHYAIQRG